MQRPLPLLAWLLGLGGIIPFAACGLLAVTNRGGANAAFALVAYGATIVAFLGGVHWGFAIPEPSGRGERARLGLGVLPSLAGWVALLLVLAVNAAAGIAALIVTVLAVTIVEARATAAGLVPRPYMRLRFVLSAAVVLILVAVLVLRLLGVQVFTW